MLTTILRKRNSKGRFAKEYKLSFFDVIKKYKQGWALDDIARIFNCDRSVVIRTLKEHNIKIRTHTQSRQEGTLYHKKLKEKNAIKRAKLEGNFSVAKNNYVLIRTKGKLIPEYRHVIEKKLGRKLLKGEVVHHIDGCRFNNKISNLIVTKKAKIHFKVHMSMQEIFYILVRLKVIKFNRKKLEYYLNL